MTWSIWRWVILSMQYHWRELKHIYSGILWGLWLCLVEHVSKHSGWKRVPPIQLWVLGGRIWRHPWPLHRLLVHGLLGLLWGCPEDVWESWGADWNVRMYQQFFNKEATNISNKDATRSLFISWNTEFFHQFTLESRHAVHIMKLLIQYRFFLIQITNNATMPHKG